MRDSQPLSVYNEQRMEGRREFRLFPTELHITAKGPFGNRSESMVSLKNARPIPNRIWYRHRLFGPFLAVTVVAALVGFACFFGPFSVDVQFLGVLAGGLGVAAFGTMTARLSPRIEYAQFVNDIGIVAFDVAAAGNERHRFPQFIDEVKRAIEGARQQITP